MKTYGIFDIIDTLYTGGGIGCTRIGSFIQCGRVVAHAEQPPAVVLLAYMYTAVVHAMTPVHHTHTLTNELPTTTRQTASVLPCSSESRDSTRSDTGTHCSFKFSLRPGLNLNLNLRLRWRVNGTPHWQTHQRWYLP